MNSITKMVEAETARDNQRRADLGDTPFLFQAMLRSTGREVGRPRLMTEREAEASAERLGAVVWFNLITGDVIYSRHMPYHDSPLARSTNHL